ncbi:MAG: hypothetical protein HOP11_11905 [Saprospiraceae bacterium]|nr:hypothetical protein [Saprospiraceae bacterium]
MKILKIILLVSKLKITFYCTENLIIKEIRENNKLTITYKYYQKKDSLLFIDHNNNNIEKFCKLSEVDFNEVKFNVEGLEILDEFIINNEFKYLNLNSIIVKRRYSIPYQENMNSKLVFCELPNLNKYILDIKYLKALNLTNNSEKYYPYIILGELKTTSNYGPENTVYKIVNIEEIEVSEKFFVSLFGL